MASMLHIKLSKLNNGYVFMKESSIVRISSFRMASRKGSETSSEFCSLFTVFFQVWKLLSVNVKTLTGKMFLNQTFVPLETDDIFQELFDNKIINYSLICLYFLGLLSCLGLSFVIWFEISGQAGHFRTLLNQLVSYKLCLLIIFYTVTIGIYTSRRIFGPLPLFVCRIAQFSTGLCGVNILLITIVISGLKFAFVFLFRSIPVMNDQLLFRIIVNILTVWTVVAFLFKFYIEEFKPGQVSLWSFRKS